MTKRSPVQIPGSQGRDWATCRSILEHWTPNCSWCTVGTFVAATAISRGPAMSWATRPPIESLYLAPVTPAPPWKRWYKSRNITRDPQKKTKQLYTFYGVTGVFAGANPSCLWAGAGMTKSPAHCRGCHARCQLHIRSNFGFSILLGFEPATFWSLPPLQLQLPLFFLLVSQNSYFVFLFTWHRLKNKEKKKGHLKPFVVFLSQKHRRENILVES